MRSNTLRDTDGLEMILGSMDWAECVKALERNQKRLVERIKELEKDASKV